MTEVRFYHLQRRTLDDVLPQLLEKALERGFRIVVRLGSPERVAAMNAVLWAYRPESFLPHGTEAEGSVERHPIFLTARDENPNQADMLVLADGTESERLDSYKLACEIFDGNDEEAVAEARRRWKLRKDAGHALTYWQQGQRGWEKKA